MANDDPADLANDDETGTTGILVGVVDNAPEGLDDPVYVTLDMDSGNVPVGPCVWTPRGEDFPAEGAAAYVAFADDETPVIVGWK